MRLPVLLSCLGMLCCLTACFPWSSQSTTRNQGAIQQPARTRLTYVAIGASDTFGIGADDPQTQCWPADLATMLGPGTRLVNLGVPDILTHDALTIELPVALDTHPDLISIWLAVNDLAANVPLDQYTHDLDTLLSRLQSSAPHARIALVNVPDLTLLPSFQDKDPQAVHAQITAYNSIIADAASRHHVLLVDLFQRWQTLANHPEYISSDGFHPSTAGYAQLALIVDQVLQKTSP